MRTVGLKTLKNKLSEYVRLAAARETVVVTDRGRAVAEIVPPRPQHEGRAESGWNGACAKGGSGLPASPTARHHRETRYPVSADT
jgi:prevent-host-death family protein